MKPTALVLLAFTPLVALAQKKEIVELQREMGLLQEQIRIMQRGMDDRFGQFTTMLQQAIEASTKANASIAVLQNTLGDQVKTVIGPVTGVSTRVDQMSDEFRSVREAVADLAARLSRLDAKLADISTAVTTLRNPVPPPDGAPPNAFGAPGVSAEQTYQNAYRDMQGGQLDLALQQFTDYLKAFPNTDYAPNAQYYIGDIYLRKGETANAIAAFDAVLERYSENTKSADARFMKGRALMQAKKPTAAAQEFRELIKRYPDTEVAAKAKAQLKALGYSVPSAGSASRSSKKRR